MSLIRENLLTRPGYSPYCGSEKCILGMPRTMFDGKQFWCDCGWRSAFDAEFIAKYKARWASDIQQKSASGFQAPQNNAEMLPKREPAGSGADTPSHIPQMLARDGDHNG